MENKVLALTMSYWQLITCTVYKTVNKNSNGENSISE